MFLPFLPDEPLRGEGEGNLLQFLTDIKDAKLNELSQLTACFTECCCQKQNSEADKRKWRFVTKNSEVQGDGCVQGARTGRNNQLGSLMSCSRINTSPSLGEAGKSS